ncbi:hypothetical protein GCM10022221_68600 [Actinocorallia aurea]
MDMRELPSVLVPDDELDPAARAIVEELHDADPDTLDDAVLDWVSSEPEEGEDVAFFSQRLAPAALEAMDRIVQGYQDEIKAIDAPSTIVDPRRKAAAIARIEAFQAESAKVTRFRKPLRAAARETARRPSPESRRSRIGAALAQSLPVEAIVAGNLIDSGLTVAQTAKALQLMRDGVEQKEAVERARGLDQEAKQRKARARLEAAAPRPRPRDARRDRLVEAGLSPKEAREAARIMAEEQVQEPAAVARIVAGRPGEQRPGRLRPRGPRA